MGIIISINMVIAITLMGIAFILYGIAGILEKKEKELEHKYAMQIKKEVLKK